MQALRAGYQEWRSPGSSARRADLSELEEEYRLRWLRYRPNAGKLYTDTYIKAHELYTYTRMVFNPVPGVVSFYEDHVFPLTPETITVGSVTAQLVTPLAEGAEDGLRLAVAQIDQWTNWLSESQRFVRYGAALGGVGAEVVDEQDREKVTHRILWPGWVQDLDRDAAGNVKEYALQYKVTDPDTKEEYEYRKEVDGFEFRYFRGGKPFDPAEREGDKSRKREGVYENIFGFVPAVWNPHIDDGDDRGLPAFWNPEKVDELNSLACHAHDRTHKAIESPKVIAAEGDVVPIIGAGGQANRTGGRITPHDSRYDWMVLMMAENGTVSDLDAGFDAALADPQIDRILKSFERDYPELQAHEIIQNKAQISGAALERMLAPSQAKLDRAASGYHQQVIKLKQMSVAIAGERCKRDWQTRDAQRNVFDGFDLDSYAQGKLNFGLRRSLLVQSTPMEDEELRGKRTERAAKLREILADPNARALLVESGYTESEADEILKRRAPAGGGGAQ